MGLETTSVLAPLLSRYERKKRTEKQAETDLLPTLVRLNECPVRDNAPTLSLDADLLIRTDEEDLSNPVDLLLSLLELQRRRVLSSLDLREDEDTGTLDTLELLRLAVLEVGEEDRELVDGRVVEGSVRCRAETDGREDLVGGRGGGVGEHSGEGRDVAEFGCETSADNVVCGGRTGEKGEERRWK
jgi:hypothetical protein